ncbi:unnamed protein product [Caenorhabditis brenneri]
MSSKSRKLSHNNNNSSSSSSNTTSMIGSGGGGGGGGVLSAGLSTPTGGVPTPQRGGSLSLSVGQTVSRPFSRSSFMLRYKGDKSGKNHNVIDAIRVILHPILSKKSSGLVITRMTSLPPSKFTSTSCFSDTSFTNEQHQKYQIFSLKVLSSMEITMTT